MSDGDPGFAVMGIVNVTPDSFSDGGLYLDVEAAVSHGLELERAAHRCWTSAASRRGLAPGPCRARMSCAASCP